MKLITLQQAADFIQVHPRTIRNWVAAGDLTLYRRGQRIIRVDQDELVGLLSPEPAATKKPRRPA